jgi:hypothetical protein
MAIKLISYNKKNAIIIGSQSDDQIKYKNDTDIDEFIFEKNSKEELIDNTYKMFLDIIKNIKKDKNAYFMELKAGIYKDLYISNEDILNNKKRNEFYKQKLQEKIIDKDLYNTINELHNSDLIYFCTNLYKVRWSMDDIKKGSTTLFNNYEYKFEEIFDKESIIKIDMLYFDGNVFQEYSNVFKIVYKQESISNFTDDKIITLREAVKELLAEGDIYKAVKRAYLIAKLNKNKETMDKLLVVINSKAGELYQVKSFIKNCENVLYKYKNKDTILKVKKSLQYIKSEKKNSKRIEILLEKGINTSTPKPLIKILIKMQQILNKNVQKLTDGMLIKYKINI